MHVLPQVPQPERVRDVSFRLAGGHGCPEGPVSTVVRLSIFVFLGNLPLFENSTKHRQTVLVDILLSVLL